MVEVLGPLAVWLHATLPEWMRLPDLTFVMPHPVYWLGLLLFPLIAMFLVSRAEQHPPDRVSFPVAYLLWLCGGFVGLHRFYLRSLVFGLVYIALFLLLLAGNNFATDARNVKSGFDNDLKIAEFMLKREQQAVESGRSTDRTKLEAAREKRDAVSEKAQAAAQTLDQWHALAGGAFAAIVAFLLVDALLIPLLVMRVRRLEAGEPPPEEFEVMERGSRRDERAEITSPAIRLIESISGWSGRFVAYWSVIAVFVYYYEVVARYVFNSPTNWAHESMFLMFGMQYLISGAYAYREDAHVRVDVIYEHFSTHAKAIIDIFTSVFFFIFTITLLLTSVLFAMDSIEVMEVSFTEWAIQYWPVKLTMVLGATLLLLQGLAKLMRDVTYVARGGRV